MPDRGRQGLASTTSGGGEVLGPEDVAYLDGDLYIGVDGGGAGHGNEDHPSGVYRMTKGAARARRRPVGVGAREPGGGDTR